MPVGGVQISAVTDAEEWPWCLTLLRPSQFTLASSPRPLSWPKNKAQLFGVGQGLCSPLGPPGRRQLLLQQGPWEASHVKLWPYDSQF